MIHSSEIFGEWYKYLLNIKNDLKNNILVKPLMTQLWATLIKTNKTKKTEEQITENNFDVGISYTHKYRIINENYDNDKTIYELQVMENPFLSNIRLKGFITSYARCMIGEIAIKTGLENIKRIHTDNIVYRQKQDFNIPNFIAEEKTSGLITWHTNGKYSKN